jgi:predicted ribosome quality control (RQC) complex YloA/Tae2 family protein
MPYDGLAMHVAARELDRLLAGGRIEKITQPEKDEVHLIIRCCGVHRRLVLSAGAENPRVHLTERAKPSPLSAPAFCMALRKRLTGGRVASIRQHGMDRVLEMTVETRNELGEAAAVTLRAEIMGRHSNLVLTEGGRVVDSVKRIARDKSRVREVLPGLPYVYPPDQGRANPLEMTEADFESMLAEGTDSLASHLASRLAGLSAATLRALLAVAADPDAALSGLSQDTRRLIASRLADRLSALRDGPGRPTLIRDPGASEAADFFPFRSQAHPESWQQERETLQQAMDEYYTLRDLRDRLRERASAMNETVRRHLDRCRRKLEKQRQTLDDAGSMERYRLYGELLTEISMS